MDVRVKPENSVSCAVTPVSASTSKVSKRSSRAGSRDDGLSSSIASERTGDTTRVAELKAKIALLYKRQALRKKKFRLQQKEFRLNLEAEMFKTTAKERVHAAMTTPSLPELNPLKLETELRDQDPPVTNPRAKTTIPGEVLYPGQGVSEDSVPYGPFDYQAFTVCSRKSRFFLVY